VLWARVVIAQTSYIQRLVAGKIHKRGGCIRHDGHANANRIKVEEEKPVNQRGTYLHPELFGESATQTSALSLCPCHLSTLQRLVNVYVGG